MVNPHVISSDCSHCNIGAASSYLSAGKTIFELRSWVLKFQYKAALSESHLLSAIDLSTLILALIFCRLVVFCGSVLTEL